MTTIGARSVAAAAALKPLGLSLMVSPAGAGFMITSDLGSPSEPELVCKSIEEVDAWIADHRRLGAAKPIEQRRAPRVGDDVHYVSHGSPVREDGSQAYQSVCRAAKVTEVYDVDPDDPGVPYVGLFVMSPNGTFHDQGVRHDRGVFAGPARDGRPGESLPQVTCADLTYKGGSWHWGGDQ